MRFKQHNNKEIGRLKFKEHLPVRTFGSRGQLISCTCNKLKDEMYISMVGDYSHRIGAKTKDKVSFSFTTEPQQLVKICLTNNAGWSIVQSGSRQRIVVRRISQTGLKFTGIERYEFIGKELFIFLYDPVE